jgi:succinylarginine dihydrolase
LPNASFTTNLVGSRVTYTMTPKMFASALVQYASISHRASTNVRLRWEYQPGSELFVVFNEERDTVIGRFPNLQTRALIVKVNRLFRF